MTESVLPSGKKHRCRVCNGPVEWPNLICEKCHERETELGAEELRLETLFREEDTPKRMSGSSDELCRRLFRGPPKFVVLCGPSHSGKSTLAKKLGKTFAVVSSDEIRKKLIGSFRNSDSEEKVWRAFEEEKHRVIETGGNIVLDACHISKGARRHSLEGVNDSYTKICVIFETPWKTIRNRCLREKRISVRRAWEIWDRFQLNKPSATELRILGFDEMFFLVD